MTTPPAGPPPHGRSPAGGSWGQPAGGWEQASAGWGRPSGGWGQAPGPGPTGPGGYRPPPKPGLIPLHPLRLGELLDGGFQAIRHNPRVMIGTPAIVMGILLLVTAGLSALSFAWLGSLPNAVTTDSDFSLGFSTLSSLGNIGVSFVEACAAQVVYGILVLSVSRAVLGEKKAFRDIWPTLKPRLWPLIGMSLLLIAMAIVILGLALIPAFALAAADFPITAIIIGILGYLIALLAIVYINIRFAVSACALVLEEIGPLAALGRSWRLTRRGFWRFTGIYILANVIGGLVTSLISTPLLLVGGVLGIVAVTSLQDHPATLAAIGVIGGILAVVVLAIASAIQYAYTGGVTALLYIDQRMRQEGLDVTLMAESERLARSTS